MIQTWGISGGSLCHRWVEGPVQVPPELLLVISVDQLKHTLVHHVSLEGKKKAEEFKLQERWNTSYIFIPNEPCFVQ